MAPLKNESELFEKLKEEYTENGDVKETFFECINICLRYSKEERRFLLYRLKQLNEVDAKHEKIDFIAQVIKLLMKKDREYGFYVAVIEASLAE